MRKVPKKINHEIKKNLILIHWFGPLKIKASLLISIRKSEINGHPYQNTFLAGTIILDI